MALSYYQLPADEIIKSTSSVKQKYTVDVEGVQLSIHPHVYPSEKFRTTRFALTNLKEKFKNKTVCDMGCGPGIVGLYALNNGASKVIQADINPYAIDNAIENAKLNNHQNNHITAIESNCFDNIPNQVFDLIVWNMPFHSDSIEVSDPLELAFYDPEFKSIKKFLSQAPDYSTSDTEIYIAFSTKGDYPRLEHIFESHGFQWTLWKVANIEQAYDNRIYSLKFSALN